MRQQDVRIGGAYQARVSGRVVTIRIVREADRTRFGGNRSRWQAINCSTGRTIFVSIGRIRPLPGSDDERLQKARLAREYEKRPTAPADADTCARCGEPCGAEFLLGTGRWQSQQLCHGCYDQGESERAASEARIDAAQAALDAQRAAITAQARIVRLRDQEAFESHIDCDNPGATCRTNS
jgi:hypothetical protein